MLTTKYARILCTHTYINGGSMIINEMRYYHVRRNIFRIVVSLVPWVFSGVKSAGNFHWYGFSLKFLFRLTSSFTSESRDIYIFAPWRCSLVSATNSQGIPDLLRNYAVAFLLIQICPVSVSTTRKYIRERELWFKIINFDIFFFVWWTQSLCHSVKNDD